MYVRRNRTKQKKKKKSLCKISIIFSRLVYTSPKVCCSRATGQTPSHRWWVRKTESVCRQSYRKWTTPNQDTSSLRFSRPWFRPGNERRPPPRSAWRPPASAQTPFWPAAAAAAAATPSRLRRPTPSRDGWLAPSRLQRLPFRDVPIGSTSGIATAADLKAASDGSGQLAPPPSGQRREGEHLGAEGGAASRWLRPMTAWRCPPQRWVARGTPPARRWFTNWRA